jgi:hypothetical protein
MHENTIHTLGSSFRRIHTGKSSLLYCFHSMIKIAMFTRLQNDSSTPAHTATESRALHFELNEKLREAMLIHPAVIMLLSSSNLIVTGTAITESTVVRSRNGKRNVLPAIKMFYIFPWLVDHQQVAACWKATCSVGYCRSVAILPSCGRAAVSRAVATIRRSLVLQSIISRSPTIRRTPKLLERCTKR